MPNGDGVDDVVISSDSADPIGQSSAGESYLVFGRTRPVFPPAFELRTLFPALGGDGSAGSVLLGLDPNDFSGSSVSDAGDVNGRRSRRRRDRRSRC
jgi:hypothetical protein